MAFLRVDSVARAGGLREDHLTEDIDLTVRLFTQTSERIVYEPHMVSFEATPHGYRDLLRQRTRWARGWAQVSLEQLGGVTLAARRRGLASASLAWQLLCALSAPWCSLLPLLALLRYVAGFDPLPGATAIALALVVLPARPIVMVAAMLRDEHSDDRGLRGAVRVVIAAYGWIVLGWILQFHALYLELTDAPATWSITQKRVGAIGRAS